MAETYHSSLCLNDAPVCTPELAIEDVASARWSAVVPMEFAPNPLPERFLVEIVEGDRAGEVAEAVALYERGNVESFRLGGRSPFAPRA